MKIFNEETKGGMCVIVLDRKEAQQLVLMCDAAAKIYKRKSTWRKMADAFDAMLGCW
jgi:hypothetical protein